MEKTDAISILEQNVERIIKSLERIERGLYGDSENFTDGLIQKQHKLQEEVEDLKLQIAAIHAKNIEQDKILNAKKDTRKSIISIVLDVVKWAAVGYLVASSAFGVDALFNKLF